MKEWMREKEALFHKIAYGSFYAAVVIEVLIVLIDKSSYINPIEGRLFQLTFLLCLVKVLLTRYTRREYVAIFLFCVLGAVSYFVTERNEILRLVMLVAACKGVDMKKCLKLVFWMTLSGCLVIVLLSVTGLYGAVSLTQDYGRGCVETRYTLGMGHPNALQCMVFALTTLGLYLYGEKMRWYWYLLVVGVNFITFRISDSRTSFLVTVFAIFMTYLSNRRRPGFIKKLAAWLNGIAVLLSIGISVAIAQNAYRVHDFIWHALCDPVTMQFVHLNDLLNGRILILTETEGWQGTTATWSLFSAVENTNYFDLGWVRLFYWYGMIPAVIFIAVVLLMMVYCYQNEHYSAIVMITAFAVYSIIEAHAISVYLARNYVFFLIGMYWWRMLVWKKEEKT